MEIKVVNLHKNFGKTRALKGISFNFQAGQTFGFVGPNGAGKTTTLRILATLDEPSGGDAFINGFSVIQYPEKARRMMGFVPDVFSPYSDMSVRDYLDFFARTYGIRGRKRRAVLEGLEEFTGLAGFKEKLLKGLSRGMKQRVSLARALIHDPPVLLLDEPAAGLDPRARVELRELLKLLSEQGKAILISSHILTELTEICDGAIIIEQGRILETGTIDELANKSTPRRSLLIRAPDRQDELFQALLEMPHVRDVRRAGKEIIIEVEGGEEAGCDLLTALVGKGFRIAEFRQQQTDLEELFMHITKGEVQ